MRFLKTNTAVRVTVGPFLDKADGITPKVALTVTSCHLTFMVDTADVPTLVLDANATASGGANDMVHVTNDDAGFYDLELATTQTNYLGRAMLSINDVATHCPVFHEFMILPALVYDSLVSGTDNLQVDTIQLVGTATGSGTVGTVTNLTNAPTNGDLTTTMKASVNAEVVDCLGTDTLAELSQAAPSATPTIKAALMLLYMALRNDLKSTSSSLTISNDAGTVICKSVLSDDGSVFERAELVSGP